MKKLSYPCPCGGNIKWKKDEVVMEGVNCGILDIEYCKKCGEEYLPDESFRVVEEKLKEKGLWGMKREKVSFWKSGNSVTLRIPTKIAKSLNLKPKEEGYIYREGDKKFVVEI